MIFWRSVWRESCDINLTSRLISHYIHIKKICDHHSGFHVQKEQLIPDKYLHSHCIAVVTLPLFYLIGMSPPMPPPNFSGLSDEELRAMEGMERQHVQARIECLKNIQSLLDAAVIQMQQYSTLISGLGWGITYFFNFIHPFFFVYW